MFSIYDDVLDEQFLAYINHTIGSLKWELHHSLDKEKEITFFNSVTTGREDYTFLFGELVKKEPLLAGRRLEVQRHYVNLYPYGIGGSWHQDDPDPDCVSFLFYPTEWKPEFQGDTSFESGEKVVYQRNRMAVFSGNMTHRGDPHFNPDHRYTIVYKTRIIS